MRADRLLLLRWIRIDVGASTRASHTISGAKGRLYNSDAPGAQSFLSASVSAMQTSVSRPMSLTENKGPLHQEVYFLHPMLDNKNRGSV